MRITVPGFSGVVRITAPQRLEDHQAQVAVDCDFRSGDLRPYYGDADTTYPDGPAGDATLFLYDEGKLIEESGDLSFARSPVFFSDNVSNDSRVFYTDNAVDNAYPMVLGSLSSSGAIPSGNKRLGVPQPAEMVFKDAFGNPLIDYEEQEGSFVKVNIYTHINSRLFATKASIDAAGIEKGNKLLVEAPGYTLGQTVRIKTLQEDQNDSTNYELEIDNDKRNWKIGELTFVKDSTSIRFSAAGHGLQDDDLVFFSHRYTNTADFPPNNLNASGTSQPFRVINATYSDFELQYYVAGSGWTTFELTSPRTGSQSMTYDQKKKVALIASNTIQFPDETLPAVTVYPGSDGKTYVASAVFGYATNEVEALWSNAASADQVMDRAYCVTFVNQFGDESEPSLPTKTLTVVPGSPVTFNTGAITASADASYKTPTEVRLYRTDATGTFRLVTTNADGSDTDTIDYATLETADPVYVDTKLDSDLGEPLSTAGWSVPPSGLKGIINAPNGIVAAYKGRTIAGAVPYAPYAWPIGNQVATDYEVVGLVPTSAGIVVVTKGMPAILIGDNPANWSMQKLEYPQGCVARRSIVDMGEFAMYASPDGLVAIVGANVEILTKPIMTREQWQLYNPSSIIAAQVEGRYIATYESSGTRKGFIYDPQTQSFTDLLTLSARAFTNDLLNDVLLMLDADGKIKKWNQDTAAFKPYSWISKWFQLPIPELMGVAQIFTTTVDLTGRDLTFVLRGYDNNQSVKIYEISTDTSPDAILGNRPFRIPYVAPGRFTAFRVELSGSIPVGTVMVSRTVDELKLAP